MFNIIFATLITLTAAATPLRDGFRGIPAGPVPELLKTAPADGCTKSPAPDIAWMCPSTIGAVKVQVAYMVQEGLYAGVGISTKGYTESMQLLEICTAAWGKPLQGSPRYDYLWQDKTVVAAMNYNRYSHETTIVILDIEVNDEIQKRKRQRAARNVDDL